MDQKAEPPLLVDEVDGVVTITFNRPDVHNAQNVEMLEQFDRVLDSLRWNRDVRVVVLAGAGRSFCSGHDLAEMQRNEVYRRNAATAEGRYWQELRLFFEPVQKFKELPIPTICLVQGYCLAAGLMFVAACDFAVAASDATFGSPIASQMAINDAEAAAFMYRIGDRRAKRVLWLGERFDATTALEWGLVDWVVPIEDLGTKRDELVERLLEAPPAVLALSKDTFSFLAELQGSRAFDRYHFLSHQLSHHTAEARERLEQRMQRLRAGASR